MASCPWEHTLPSGLRHDQDWSPATAFWPRPRSDANHVCHDPARVGNVFFVFSESWKGSWTGAKEGGDRIPEPRGKGVERTVTPSGRTPSPDFLATSLLCPALGLLKPVPDYGHGLRKRVRARTV